MIVKIEICNEEREGFWYRDAIDSLEKDLLAEVLTRTEGNKSHAAKMLGINRATLRMKAKRHGFLD